MAYKQMHIRVPQQTMQIIDRIVAESGKTKAEVARDAIREYAYNYRKRQDRIRKRMIL